MSDVILYAALKQNIQLQQELLSFCSGGSGITESFYETPQPAGYPIVGAGSSDNCPQIVIDWVKNLKPQVKVGQPNGFKVCDTSGYFRCGSNCSFTVPAGVCRVQFQLWGPGSGTSSNCCCGGSPFGPSGAYTVVELDVTPGNVYCLCSGCAQCCYAYQTTPGICGGPTFVCGPGLNVCADSGISCYNFWAANIQAAGHGQGTDCGIPHFDGCSASSCGGWNFCWDSGQDNTCILHAFSSRTFAYACAGTGRNLVCYGLNGLWPAMVIGQDLTSGTFSISTPVFGYENCVCRQTWAGSTCSGCCRSPLSGGNTLAIPGAGGHAAMVFSGCNACGGDSGRMGMVCASWTCN